MRIQTEGFKEFRITCNLAEVDVIIRGIMKAEMFSTEHPEGIRQNKEICDMQMEALKVKKMIGDHIQAEIEEMHQKGELIIENEKEASTE